MAKGEGKVWNEKLLERLLEVIEGLDDDDIENALTENLDLNEVIKDILNQDSSITEALKAKIKKLALKHIDGADDMPELMGDSDFDFGSMLNEEVNIQEIITQMLKEDADFTNSLKKIVKKEIKAYLEDSDNEFVSGDQINENIDFEKILKEVLGEADTQKVLATELKKIIVQYIEENLSSDDIPDGSLEEVITNQVQELLKDPKVIKEINEKLEENLKEQVLEAVGNNNEAIAEQLQTNENFKREFGQNIDDLLRDRDFLAGLRKKIQERISHDDGFVSKMIDAMVKNIAKALLERLFEKH